MNMQQFKTHIRTIPVEALDDYFDQISAKMNRARNQNYRLGYALALDELVIEKNLRQFTLCPASEAMSDDQLLAALSA